MPLFLFFIPKHFTNLTKVATKSRIPRHHLNSCSHLDHRSHTHLLLPTVSILHKPQYIMDMLDIYHHGYASHHCVCNPSKP
jgi:hypothetical protein